MEKSEISIVLGTRDSADECVSPRRSKKVAFKTNPDSSLLSSFKEPSVSILLDSCGNKNINSVQSGTANNETVNSDEQQSENLNNNSESQLNLRNNPRTEKCCTENEDTAITIDLSEQEEASEDTVDEELEREAFLPLPKIKMSHLPKRLPIDLEFSELTYCVESERKKSYKTILKGVSGKFRPGHLSAIMGPSGAGKSTLMNILAGYRTSRVSGEILVNGKPRCLRSFRKQSCYIMQEDELLPFLTVQESMDVAAILKLGNDVPEAVKDNVVQEILETLCLGECRTTRVVNLSGGEKKRLSVALELVNNPPIMFFDEPTSGLDSQNSYHCINLLRSLAEEDRTIICTIHQPSARLFEKFDMLYALAEGQCIYKGSIHGLVPFMSSLALECPSYHNPADFLVEVASGEYGKFIPKLVGAVNCGFVEAKRDNQSNGRAIELDLVSPSNGTQDNGNKNGKLTNGDCIYSPKKNTKLDLTSCEQKFLEDATITFADYPATYWTQFSVLFKRTFLSIVRDKMLTKLRLAAHIFIGIFIGILYYNIGNEASKALNNVGCLFFGIMFLLFTAMMPTILTFPLEMKVFIREHLNHWYSLKTYYFAKVMADMPFQILFPLLYVVIVYFMTNQPLEGDRFALFTILCIMTSLVAQSIGLTIGAAMDVQQAVFFGPAVAIPALLFSGFFVSFSTIPVYLRWLTFLSYIRYGYEGTLLAIYGGERETLECSEAFCMFKYPAKILEQLDLEESFIWFDLSLLFIYFLVVRTLGYFILRWKLRKER